MSLTVAELRYLFTANTASMDRGFAKAQAGVRSMEKAGTRMAATGTKMSKGLTLPMLAAGAAAGKMASDYESSMQKIVGLVGISQKQVDAWSKQVLNLSKDLPQSPKDLADAMFFVTSAGFRGKEALDVLTASAKASAAGLGDTEAIADAVTSAVNAYGIKNLSASKATDILTASVREGKLEASSLAPVLGRVIPIASELGVSFDQVGAAAAVLSKTGLNAAEATTAVRQIMQSLIKPTVQGKKELKKVGLTYEDLRKQVKEKGLFKTLMTLRDAFGDNTEALSKVIPQVEGFAGVLAITGKGSKEAKKTFKELSDATGATRKAFAVASETGANRFKTALGKVQANAVKLGQVLLPVGTAIVTMFGDMVNMVANLPGPVLKVVGVFAVLLATLGPLLVVIGKAIKLVFAFRAGILATSAAAAASKGPLALFAFGIKAVSKALRANPIGAVITLIVALGAALVLAYKKSETFRRIVDAVFRAIATAGKWMWERVLKPAFSAIGKAFRSIGDTFSSVWDRVLRPVFKTLVDAFLWVAEKIVDGAAKAFGWVPGIGPKLRSAADKFRTFRRDVNNALGGIKDKDVAVTGKLAFGGAGTGSTAVNRLLSSSFATGGLVPGAPSSRDNRIAAVASGEFVVNSRSTRKHRPLLEAVNADRLPGFAEGGVVPRAVVPSGRDARRFASEYGSSISIAARKFQGVLDEALSKVFSAPGVGSGVERWRGLAMRALAYTGSPLSWIGSLLRRMQQESGGNPFAINNWDINARRGDPSRGLMQTIGSTFRAYARELVGRGIYDPFANIVASIRYANARYGAAPVGWNQPGGYARGTIRVPRTERALVHKDEMILPARIAEAVRQQLAGGGERVVIHQTVNAPQNMSPQQVADAGAQRIASAISQNSLGAVVPV
ncbi:phage tail tape measure protein [Haloechinothrix halophila]|uniref:Phage tail tape measure protein, TP901 family n=1 Tax=Haloechinothrix halophila YIM 93223 TaxID=592678 RepID=W9DNA5_9PSEU|nr:phage tail tape measure protein [Haloechinothrix halophila]ETA66365.1 phage tail tape measure protein, TP901 family [Haloechinothrix halophila YIM 93223]